MLSNVKIFMSGIWRILKPYVQQFIAGIGPVVLAVCIEVVKEVATSYTKTGNDDIDDRKRREMAFNLAKIKLSEKGIQVGVDVARSMIWDGIQAATKTLPGKDETSR